MGLVKTFKSEMGVRLSNTSFEKASVYLFKYSHFLKFDTGASTF